jgi:hypothetical protein
MNNPFLRRRTLLLLLLLALALLVPWAGAHIPSRRYGPAKLVETTNAKVGIHTRLTDEVEEKKIARTLQMVREMGASWVVEYFPWAYIEPEKGRYEWAHADMVVDYAVVEGLTMIARIDYVPDWARPEQTTSRYLDPARYNDFGDFVFAFVSHYKDRIHYYIIWNEPNLAAEWGYRGVSPGEYTALLKVAYQRAKEADPQAQILAAGLAPTLDPPGSAGGLNDLDFLQGMYDAGAKDYFDILAVHSYGWQEAPDAAPAPDHINWRRTELLRQIMERNGDAAKQAMITEGGWNDHPRWARAVRPGQRIAYTLRAYEMAKNDWSWCMSVNMWAFRLPRPAHSFNDYFTFVREDFTPKPIYTEVQKYARGR